MINLTLESALGLLEFILVILVIGVLIIGASIYGMYRSMTIKRKIKLGVKEDRFKDFSDPNVARRIRRLALIALISWFGALIIIILTLIGVKSVDYKIILFVFILCGLTASFAGLLIYRAVLKRINK